MADHPLLGLPGDWQQADSLHLLSNSTYEDGLDTVKIKQNLALMWQGGQVNFTESRRALHVLHRINGLTDSACMHDQAWMCAQDEKMYALADTLKGVKHILCVGQGGSALGLQCLNDFFQGLPAEAQIFFVDHCDEKAMKRTLKQIEQSKALVVYISKSGTTNEVIWASEWLEAHWPNHPRVLITANPKAAITYGVKKDNMILLHPEVNGRLSIWSPVIFPILLVYGRQTIDAFRQGASLVDKRMMEANDLKRSLPYKLANIWYNQQQLLSFPVLWMLAYGQCLCGLGPHLQQLLMESLGKVWTKDDHKLLSMPGPIVMPMMGHHAQHAAMQYLHHNDLPMMVHGLSVLDADLANSHQHLIAQYKAMTQPSMASADIDDRGEKHRVHRTYHHHHKSVTMMLLADQAPHTLGELIATYEYATLMLGFNADINPFDQYGVEKPKQLMREMA